MGLFGPPDVERAKAAGKIEALLQAATYKKDPAVAAAGREALEGHLDLLIRELDSKNIRRLKIAREALVCVGPAARDRLIFILGEGHTHRRQDAAFVLGEMRDPAAVPPLARALRHPDSLLRLLAIQALGKIGGDEAVEAIRTVLFDPEPKVATEARKAIKKLGRH